MGYRIVKMTRELFTELFTEGWMIPQRDNCRIRCVEGLPEGARLEAVSMHTYFNEDVIALKFSHSSWPDQLSGFAIPVIPVSHSIEELDVPHIVPESD